MRKNSRTTVLLSACLLLLSAAPAQAQEGAPKPGMTGEATPKLFSFNLTGGPGADRTHFLERYKPKDGLGSSDESGFYFDADLNLVYGAGSRDLLVIERRGDGLYSNTNALRLNAEKAEVTGYYSRYRSEIGGLGYLYSPNVAPGGTDPAYNTPPQTASGYFARFNEDFDRTRFASDRETYGAALKLKPALLGEAGAIDFRYDGYQRDGNQLSTWIAGGSDFAGTQVQLQRWRGFDQPIDETMGRASLSATLAPRDWFQLVYDGSVEKFDNKAASYTIGDFASNLPPSNSVSGTNGTKPLLFVPDSELTNHALRFSKQMGGTAIAAGYSVSRLEQENFTQRQTAAGYTKGEIGTEYGFLNLSTRVSKTVTLEGHLTYSTRDNDSTFPAPPLIAPTNSQTLGVRVDSLERLGYGLEGTVRTGRRTTLTGGWKHLDTTRDLTFNNGPTGITQERSLYYEDSATDELYLKFVSRPARGWTLRITPSYLRADETGLVVEPEEAFRLRALASYLTPGGALISGYYNLIDTKNGNNSFYNALSPTGATGAAVTQNVESAMQSAGASFSVSPSEKASLSLGLDWIQNDFETFYFSTNRRRFENPASGITFTTRDRPGWKVDTLSASLSGDWNPTEHLTVTGGYTYARSDGAVSAGLVADELATTVERGVDNTLHSFLVGGKYSLKEKLGLQAQVLYEDYKDDLYDLLSGSLVTVTFGVAVGF